MPKREKFFQIRILTTVKLLGIDQRTSTYVITVRFN